MNTFTMAEKRNEIIFEKGFIPANQDQSTFKGAGSRKVTLLLPHIHTGLQFPGYQPGIFSQTLHSWSRAIRTRWLFHLVHTKQKAQ